jgi:hypothetical protein
MRQSDRCPTHPLRNGPTGGTAGAQPSNQRFPGGPTVGKRISIVGEGRQRNYGITLLRGIPQRACSTGRIQGTNASSPTCLSKKGGGLCPQNQRARTRHRRTSSRSESAVPRRKINNMQNAKKGPRSHRKAADVFNPEADGLLFSPDAYDREGNPAPAAGACSSWNPSLERLTERRQFSAMTVRMRLGGRIWLV